MWTTSSCNLAIFFPTHGHVSGKFLKKLDGSYFSIFSKICWCCYINFYLVNLRRVVLRFLRAKKKWFSRIKSVAPPLLTWPNKRLCLKHLRLSRLEKGHFELFEIRQQNNAIWNQYELSVSSRICFCGKNLIFIVQWSFQRGNFIL